MALAWEKDLLLVIIKVFFVAITAIYAIFSFMVVRQVGLMNKGFTTSLHGIFTFLAWAHFFVSVLAVFLVYIIF